MPDAHIARRSEGEPAYPAHVDMAEWVRNEQAILWHDLDSALRSAIDGTWSIQAANVAARIVSAARLVGPTPHGEAPYNLVAGGVYAAVLHAGGIEPDLPDEDEWQRLDTLMATHNLTRAVCGPRLAATVARINSPRESAYIGAGTE